MPAEALGLAPAGWASAGPGARVSAALRPTVGSGPPGLLRKTRQAVAVMALSGKHRGAQSAAAGSPPPTRGCRSHRASSLMTADSDTSCWGLRAHHHAESSGHPARRACVSPLYRCGD